MQANYEHLVLLEAALRVAEREGFVHTAAALELLKERAIVETVDYTLSSQKQTIGACT